MNATVTSFRVFPQISGGNVALQCLNALHEENVIGPDASIERDAFGRPVLKDSDIDCNWSHSGELIALGWSQTKRVGIDIERIRPRPRALEIAQRFFASTEAQELATLENPLLAFLELWCLKEAVLKAHGQGISFGMERAVFGLSSANQWELKQTDPSMGTGWGAQLFAAPDGYVGALAWRDR